MNAVPRPFLLSGAGVQYEGPALSVIQQSADMHSELLLDSAPQTTPAAYSRRTPKLHVGAKLVRDLHPYGDHSRILKNECLQE